MLAMSFVCRWAVGDGETEERFSASLGMTEGILPLCNATSGARRANFCKGVDDIRRHANVQIAVDLPCGCLGPSDHVLIVAILFQVTIQTGATDPQYLRSPQTIPFAHCQHSLDVLLAHLFQGQGRQSSLLPAPPSIG